MDLSDELRLKQILEAPSTTPLSFEEERFLYNSDYVFDETTPARIRDNVRLMFHSYETKPSSINIHEVDFSSLDVQEYLSVYNTEKHFLYRMFEISGVFNDSFPNANVHRETCKLERGPYIASLVGEMQEAKNYVIFDNFTYDVMSKEEKELLLDCALYYKCPIGRLPDAWLQDRKVLEIFRQGGLLEVDDSVIEVLCSKQYSEDLEKRFAQAYGVEDIEGFIREKTMTSIDILKVPLEARLASQKLSMQKELHTHGVDDVSICINMSYLGLGTRGGYSKINNTIYIPGSTSHYATEESYYVGYHESDHAIQEHNVRTGSFTKDGDVDIYTKDHFLRDVLGQQYYTQNYVNISSEFDADLKAQIRMNNIRCGSSTNIYDVLKRKVASRAVELEQVLEDITTQLAYSHSSTRKDLNGNVMHIDDLVEIELEKKMASCATFEEFQTFIDTNFPLLGKEYHLSPDGIRKKTPQELVECMDKAETLEEYEIYDGLIISSMDSRKNNNASQNIETYMEMASDSRTPNDIRVSLNVNARIAMEQNKYRGEISPTVDTGKVYGM